jgi:hypothetical protein
MSEDTQDVVEQAPEEAKKRISGKITDDDFKYDSDGLNKRQRAFCEAYVYLTEYDITRAMELAGYRNVSKYDLKILGKKMLKKPKILAQIKKMKEVKEQETVVDKLWIVTKLKKIVDDNEHHPNFQLKALELLGKYLNMFGENKNVDPETQVDAADVAKAAFEERKKLLKLNTDSNGGNPNDAQSASGTNG